MHSKLVTVGASSVCNFCRTSTQVTGKHVHRRKAVFTVMAIMDGGRGFGYGIICG